MGNKNTDDFKKQGYTMIEYPLKGNENLIENDTKNCTNFHKANHDNIDIIYTSKNSTDNIPTIYRCQICLCIPILVFKEPNILFKCNCGDFNCSIDYFLTNFPSYPIDKINYTEKKETKEEISFCSTCSKFIEASIHRKEYFGHPIKIIDGIFFKSETGENFNEFYYKTDNIDYIYYINSPYDKEENEKLYDYDGPVKYETFIKNFLDFDINKLIENRLKSFTKKFNEKKGTSSDTQQIQALNKKLFIFSKFLYYAFIKNYNTKTYNFPILLNLAYNCAQIYNPDLYNKKNKNKKPKEFDIYKTFFLEDLRTALDRYEKPGCLKTFMYHIDSKLSASKIVDVVFDIYSKRYVIQLTFSAIITQKNDIATVAHSLRHMYFIKLIYVSSFQRNILVYKRRSELIFSEVEDLRIINKTALDKTNSEGYDSIIKVEFLENEFLIIIYSHKYLIYKLIMSNAKVEMYSVIIICSCFNMRTVYLFIK